MLREETLSHGNARPHESLRRVFPFSAIVGQDEMKQALLIAAVDPRIGGVLVFGDRGTGNRRRCGRWPPSCRSCRS